MPSKVSSVDIKTVIQRIVAGKVEGNRKFRGVNLYSGQMMPCPMVHSQQLNDFNNKLILKKLKTTTSTQTKFLPKVV
jgi:hypothetical protein